MTEAIEYKFWRPYSLTMIKWKLTFNCLNQAPIKIVIILQGQSQSWSTSYLDSMSLGFAKLASINKSCLKNSSTKIFFVEDLKVNWDMMDRKKGPISNI